MKSAKRPQSIILFLLTLGLLLTISPGEENRYGYTTKPSATKPPASKPSLHPITPAPAEAGFWQRFRKDLKSTGRELGKALGRTRDELNYSFHNSTTKFPKNNNLNRHQKRFSGHVRTRNEAQSTPYQKPPALIQPQFSLPTQNRTPKPIREATPPRPPLEIVRPNKQPKTKKPPVSKPPSKQQDATTRPVEKNEKPPAPLTPPPPKQPAQSTPPPDKTVADKKPEQKKKPDYPFALKTENSGFVKSPYPPFALMDVRDIKPGGLAMEPDSDRIFRIPE